MPRKPLTDAQRQAKNARAREHYRGNKEQHRARVKRWMAKNPEKVRAIQRRRKGTPAPTRVEPAHCECCGRRAVDTLCLDHDHVTGVFRGWLCRQCNAGIGQLGDTPESVERALAYLKRASDEAWLG